MNGEVNSCALWFAHDDNGIYYLSSLSTQHGEALCNGGQVAFTINRDDQFWKDIVGLQGRGKVNLVDENEIQNAWETYVSKYSFVAEQFPEIEQAIEKTKLWKLTPTWIRLIDNRVAFGHHEEFTIGAEH